MRATVSPDAPFHPDASDLLQGTHEFSRLEIPPGVILTADRRRFREAAAVTLHLPSMKWLQLLKKPPNQR